MSTVRTITYPEEGLLRAEWASLTDGESGDMVQCSQFGARTLQVSGTFGTGGTIIAEGSNDGSVWSPLTDDGTAAISFTAAGIALIWENPQHVRVRVSAGTGVNVKAVLLAAR